jgi:uncharacterized protein
MHAHRCCPLDGEAATDDCGAAGIRMAEVHARTPLLPTWQTATDDCGAAGIRMAEVHVHTPLLPTGETTTHDCGAGMGS